MPTCKTPLWMLQQLQDVVDGSDLGRKGLAARLDVSEAQLGYWLTGREQFPLLRFRQAAEALGGGAEGPGARLLGILAGETYGVYFRGPGVASAESLERLQVDQIAAESRFLTDLCGALKDRQITRRELDRIVRDARSAEGLIRAIEHAARRVSEKEDA